MPKPNKKQREKMKAAVAYLQEYMSTYSSQSEIESYSEETYINDVLYGLGVSLDKKNEWAGGFENFKERLRLHLRPNSLSSAAAVGGRLRRMVSKEKITSCNSCQF